MAMLRYGSATIVDPHVTSEQWQKSVCCGHKGKCACGTKSCRTKTAKTVLAKYAPEKYILSHCTIVAAVAVDDAKESKSAYNNYLIKPEYSSLVNNNGDAWDKDLLVQCYKTFIGSDNFCFPTGTRVLMADGVYKAIELIQEGDRVINRKGEIAVVSSTFQRVAEGLTEITGTKIMSRSLFATKDHPFWVYSARKTCPKTGRPNLFSMEKDFWRLDSWVGFSVGVHRYKGEVYPVGLTPSWVEAQNMDTTRDFLTHPYPMTEIENSEINENRAELIGWYLAEGILDSKNEYSDNESGVTFCLGNDEIDVAHRLSSLLTQEFGEHFRKNCEPRIYESESGSWILTLSNKIAAEFFKKWCGKWAWAKKMPEEALWLPKKYQVLILKHCLNGDGCGAVTSRGYSLEMKSQSLIQQMQLISWRLGLLPTYKETGVLNRYTECEIIDGFEVFTDPITGKKSRPGYMLRYTTIDSKRLNDLCGHKDLRISSRLSKKKTHFFEHEESRYFLSKIDTVKPSGVTCDVYNIEVEGDNSYVVEGVVVHNCEHVQIPELSKGKCIDAVIREVPIGKDKEGKDLTTYYVDVLVATERKHKDLVRKIEAGETSRLSMGCKIAFSICSKCGNKAVDESEACNHVKYEKGNTFYDASGVQRKVAELCGHSSDPTSVTFMDVSWVENPAFTGAVVRNVINPPENVMAKIKEAEKKEAYDYNMLDFLKAAHNSVLAEDPPPPADKPEDSSPADKEEVQTDLPPAAEPTDTPPEDATPPEGSLPEEPSESDIKVWRDKIKKKLLKQISDEIEGEMSGEDDERPTDLETLDENLIQPTASSALKQMWTMKNSWDKFLKKTASHLDEKNFYKLKFGTYMVLTSNDMGILKDYGYNKRDFLAVLSSLDGCFKHPLSIEIKKALASLSGTNGLTSDKAVYALQKLSGRKLQDHEMKKAFVWLKLLDLYQE